MKWKILVFVCFLFGSFYPSFGDAKAPKGWSLNGSALKDYECGVDKSEKHSGKHSGFLASKSSWKKGFGTLMQAIQATRFRGKRVRLSAWIKTQNVRWWSGLWMRVDGKKRKLLAFDNMQRRPIRGTNGWKRYAVVLDVADEATKIAFGVLLSGQGKIWLDTIALEVVSLKVPSTNQLPKPLPTTPQNTSFEK